MKYLYEFVHFCLKVNGQPDLQDITHVENWESGAVRNSVVEDMVAMVTATSHVAPDVARALAELNQQVSVEVSDLLC